MYTTHKMHEDITEHEMVDVSHWAQDICSMMSIEAVALSISAFIEQWLKTGSFHSFMIAHPKKVEEHVAQPFGSYVTSFPLRNHGEKTLGGAHFYCDGQISIAVGLQNQDRSETLWFGSISIVGGTELRGNGFDLPSELGDYPTIVQILGFNQSNFDDDQSSAAKALEVQRGYQWEYCLVKMITEWSRIVGFSSIFFLPASFRRNFDSMPREQQDRLSRRYDRTARQCGFSLQANGCFRMLNKQ